MHECSIERNAMKSVGLRKVDNYKDLLVELQLTIEELRDRIPKWIPCSERLPEDDTEVLVYLFEHDSPYIAWVCDCRWYTEEFEIEKENHPKAWMPLPKPYMKD